jgi:hypothetical protein
MQPKVSRLTRILIARFCDHIAGYRVFSTMCIACFRAKFCFRKKNFSPYIIGYERCATECFVASAFLRTPNSHAASRDLDEQLALLRFRFPPQHRIEAKN